MNQLYLDDGLSFEQLFTEINRLVPDNEGFSLIETRAALDRMAEGNKIMLSENMVYRI